MCGFVPNYLFIVCVCRTKPPYNYGTKQVAPADTNWADAPNTVKGALGWAAGNQEWVSHCLGQTRLNHWQLESLRNGELQRPRPRQGNARRFGRPCPDLPVRNSCPSRGCGKMLRLVWEVSEHIGLEFSWCGVKQAETSAKDDEAPAEARSHVK